MGLSNPLFLTDAGDIGRVLTGTPAETRAADEIFLFDDVPLAFVLRRLVTGESEHKYALIACAQMPAAEAYAGDGTVARAGRLQISVV